jgi:hypothetical protein
LLIHFGLKEASAKRKWRENDTYKQELGNLQKWINLKIIDKERFVYFPIISRTYINHDLISNGIFGLKEASAKRKWRENDRYEQEGNLQKWINLKRKGLDSVIFPRNRQEQDK